MIIKYDKEADALYIKFSSGEVSDSMEIKPGVIVDYDNEGNVIGIEILR